MTSDTITITGELAKTIRDEAKAAKKKPSEVIAEWAKKQSDSRINQTKTVYKNPLPETDPLGKMVITESWQLDFINNVVKVQKALGKRT